MDADAFIKKNSTVTHYEADAIVASFIVALSIIDRTILPRAITFFNDSLSLRLAVAGRKARVIDRNRLSANGEEESTYLVQQLASICRRAPVRHTIRPVDMVDFDGYGISQMVNSQYPANKSFAFDKSIAPESAGKFSFDQQGWPLAMPDDAPAKALDNAWRSIIGSRGCLERTRKACGSQLLIIATSRNASVKVAVNTSRLRTDIMPVTTASLGRLISAWKSSSGAKE